MADPLENAEKRLALLREEIARVEQFIRDYHVFAAEPDSGNAGKESRSESDGYVSDTKSVDSQISSRRRSRPDEIAEAIEAVIRSHGRPMMRGQIVEALEDVGFQLPAIDKARYIGTIIWRNKGTFKNVAGEGYWLRMERRRDLDDDDSTPSANGGEESEDIPY